MKGGDDLHWIVFTTGDSTGIQSSHLIITFLIQPLFMSFLVFLKSSELCLPMLWHIMKHSYAARGRSDNALVYLLACFLLELLSCQQNAELFIQNLLLFFKNCVRIIILCIASVKHSNTEAVWIICMKFTLVSIWLHFSFVAVVKEMQGEKSSKQMQAEYIWVGLRWILIGISFIHTWSWRILISFLHAFSA